MRAVARWAIEIVLLGAFVTGVLFLLAAIILR